MVSVKSQLGRSLGSSGKTLVYRDSNFGVRTHLDFLTLRARLGHEDYYLFILNSDQRVLSFALAFSSPA